MGVSEGTGAAMATANEMGRAVSRRAVHRRRERFLNAKARSHSGTATMRCTFT